MTPPDSNNGRSSIPFEVDPGGHIFVSATLMGQTVPAILDSGAATTVLDRRFANSLGLQAASTNRAAGLTDAFTVGRVAVPPIAVGDHTTRSAVGVIADLSSISSSLGRDVRLVLGQDWLAGASVTLNFSTHLISFEGVDAPLKPGYASLALRISPHGRLYLPVMLEQSTSVEAMYDLGSNVPLYVSGEYARAHGLLKGREVSESATVGGEGLSIAQIATLKTLSLGPYILRNVPFQVPKQWNQVAPVLIGAPIWQRFENVINLDQRRLALCSDPERFDLPFTKDRSGIGAQRLADRLKVIFIAPNSPAEAAGIKVGDEVTAIDGVSVGPGLYASRPRPGAEPSGTIERLQLTSGRAAQITLRDYF